jgi:hypothetical protein
MLAIVKRLICVLFAATTLADAQKAEIGGVAGFGAVAASDLTSAVVFAAGAEICGLCSGSFAVFGEYSHLERIGSSARFYDIRRFDLAGVGLRIQGGRRVRPFFDVGFAWGKDEFGENGSHANPGAVLAGGAAVGLGGRFYVRPQLRLYALRGLHVIAAGTVGIGTRF